MINIVSNKFGLSVDFRLGVQGISGAVAQIARNVARVALPALVLAVACQAKSVEAGPIAYAACMAGCAAMPPICAAGGWAACLAALAAPTP